MIGLVIVVAGALSAEFVVSEALHRRRIAPVAFDRALWLGETDARSEKEENWRNRMADDVVRRWVHAGMTRVQVVSLLGPGQPLTKKDYDDWQGGDRSGSDPRPAQTAVLAYWTLDRIDLDGGSGPVEEIYVFLDSEDRVIRVEQGIATN